MASSPSYGDRPALQSYRRSFTAPHRALSHHERAGLDDADAAADILYSHPTARIYSFAPPRESIVSSSNVTLPDTDYPVDTVETLPWRSRTETLVAAGLMIIEKIRGSTNFLKSQGMMHAILRNSQCWCVDGESKFVMRVRKLQYYRIELPSTTEDDKAKVEELKQVLAKIMRFERTPCPFKRAFQVELPDDAITPRRKGQWKPTEPTEPKSPGSDPLPLRRTKNVRSWSMQSPSPLTTRSGRSTDYGFCADSVESPRQRYQSSEGRSMTPSSQSSSENLPEHFAEDNGYRFEPNEGSVPDTDVEHVHEQLMKSEIMNDSVSGTPLNTQIVPQVGSKNVEQEQQSVYRSNALQVQPEQTYNPHREADSTQQVDYSSVIAEQIATKEVIVPEESRKAETQAENASTVHDLVSETDTASDLIITPAPFQESEHSEPTTTDEPAASSMQPENMANHMQKTELPPNDAVVAETKQDISVLQDDQPILTGTRDVEDLPINAIIPAIIPGAANQIEVDIPNLVNDSEAYNEPEKLDLRIKESTIDKLKQAETLDEVEAAVNILKEDLMSRVSSADSFHTIDEGEQVPSSTFTKDHHHRRELSDVTVTASTVDDNTLDRFITTEDKPTTPTLARSSASDSSWPEIETPSSAAIALTNENLRRRFKSQRSMSPMPSASTIFTPSRNTSQGNHLTSDILQKACNLALVKPIEMVVLLVHILVRIAGGATVNDLMNGDLFKRPEQHRRNASFPDHVASPTVKRGMVLSDDEDDFGVPLVGKRRSSSQDSAVLMGKGITATAASKDNDTDSMFDDLD